MREEFFPVLQIKIINANFLNQINENIETEVIQTCVPEC